jgi:hypothetical protein
MRRAGRNGMTFFTASIAVPVAGLGLLLPALSGSEFAMAQGAGNIRPECASSFDMGKRLGSQKMGSHQQEYKFFQTTARNSGCEREFAAGYDEGWGGGGTSSFAVNLQTKSFIAGFNLFDPAQFDPGWFMTASCTEALMGAVVQCGVVGGENPPDGTSGTGNFRLRSEFTADITCSGDMITSWSIKPVAIENSNEFIVFLTTGEVLGPQASPALSGSTPVDKVTFSYGMRGKPNIVGNALMWGARPRTCPYIWHTVQGTLACRNGDLVDEFSFAGSAFPSHRFWKNSGSSGGMSLVKEIPQGPFKNLWICNPSSPEYVQ